MSPLPVRSGGAPYAKTLFLVDHDATVGGVAGGLADLGALDAHGIELERLTVAALSLPLNRIAKMGRERNASLVAVGVSDSSALFDGGIVGRSALPDHPLLYVGVSSPAGFLIPTPGRILRHVLVPGDYSVRSGCVASCLMRIARRGAGVVTLMHVPDAGLSRACSAPSIGEIGRVDTDWVEQLKHMLFSAGVDEVRFSSPAQGSPEFDQISPSVSLVLVGGTCNAEIALAYVSAAGHLLARRDDIPALMLTAESCLVGASALGAA